MTKKKKIILSISSVLLVLILYGWFFGVQTFFVLATRSMLNDPVFEMVPEPMAIESSSVPVMTLAAYDYSFSIPWGDVHEEGTSTSMTWWASSDSNLMIVCFVPEQGAYRAIMDSEVRAWDDETGFDPQGFMKALGLEGVTETNYYLYKKMWNVTPRNISIFDSREEAVVNSSLLVGKSLLILPSFSSNVYDFSVNDVKGVQMGDTSKDRYVQLALFDLLDREIRMTIRAFTNAPAITQSDINTIITTFSVNP